MKYAYYIISSLFLLILNGPGLNAQVRTLSLQESLNLAAKGNRQLQIKVLESKKAAEFKMEAESNTKLSVTLNSSYQVYTERPVIYLRNESLDPKIQDTRFGGRYAFDATVLAHLPIYNPAVQNNIRLAEINYDLSKLNSKVAEEEIAFEIATTYFIILYQKEQINVLKQSLHRNEMALKDSRSLFFQGKNLKTDTLSNFISIQSILASISSLQNNIQVLSIQMKNLMGLDDSLQIECIDSLLLVEIPTTKTEMDNVIAIENRKDFQVQTKLIEKSKQELKFSRSLFKPQISFIGQYQVQNQADNLKFWNYSLPRTSFAGVRLSVPVYSGGKMKSKERQGLISINQHELALEDLKNKISTEVVSLKLNLKEAYTQLSIQKQRTEAAQINYSMMNDRYRNGLGNRLELTDAELGITNAKLQELLWKYNIRLVDLRIRKAVGLLELK
ncbi:TolC family protein [Flavihumibacter cheonanensis]|uniref:TolC family protein n=1 Tax=Flavihumibacter cheonanensis TaxID=1442385 RepID=UPI001EF96D26|nr:TolC family protein [Flavihumibacter cheonanensis]MCG7752878.1 TolC family protein [Flavihumibacter cheonanensis]